MLPQIPIAVREAVTVKSDAAWFESAWFAALLGAVGVLGGVWVGARLAFGYASRQRVIDLRRELYAEVFHAYDKAIDAGCEDPDNTEEAGITIGRIALRAELLGARMEADCIRVLAIAFGNRTPDETRALIFKGHGKVLGSHPALDPSLDGIGIIEASFLKFRLVANQDIENLLRAGGFGNAGKLVGLAISQFFLFWAHLIWKVATGESLPLAKAPEIPVDSRVPDGAHPEV